RLRVRSDINLNPKLALLLREQVYSYRTLICNAYESSTFVLPNRKVQPRESWRVELPLLLKIAGKAEGIDLLLACTYEGTRSDAGKTESLVRFDGKVQGRGAMKGKIEGDVLGKFTFDTRRHFISSVNLTIASEAAVAGAEVHALFEFHVDLTRVEGNPHGL